MTYQSDILTGHKILVTGGGSGLGFAMSQSFARHGADVAICGRSQDKLDAALKKLAKYKTNVSAFSLDVRDYDAVGQVVSDVSSEFGGLTGLVNNAAGNFYAASEDLSPRAFKSVVDIVLHGTFNCTQQAAKLWIDKQQTATVLNIVTTYTETGSAFVLPSACAKAGVSALTTSLAREWAEYNIRINSIAPGPIPTDGAWAKLVPDKELENTIRERLPMKRFGTPEELGNLAVFLMSDLSSYINGTCITMDGGEQLVGPGFNMLADLFPREELKEMFSQMKESKG